MSRVYVGNLDQCRNIGSRGQCRSPSPRRRRSSSYGGRKSPRRRSTSPRRGPNYSRSPPYRHSCCDSPYANW